MSYTPHNPQVYFAAFSGAMAGFSTSLTDTNYTAQAEWSDAFAQEVDTVFGAFAYTQLQLATIQEASFQAWSTRSPLPTPDNTNPVAYESPATAVVDMALAVAAQAPSTTPTTPASWAIAQWYLDPANATGNASDANAGTLSSAPLKTVAGLVAKWGTDAPTLRQTTTLTFLSSHTDNSDPMRLNPYLTCPNNGSGTGSSLVITGTNPVAHSGTLGAVTAKNRATGQLWQVDIGVDPTPYIGTVLFHDITRGAICFIRGVVDGHPTVAQLTQPLSPQVEQTIGHGSLSFVDTLAEGDSYELLTLQKINISSLVGSVDTQDPAGFPGNRQIFVQNCLVFDPTPTPAQEGSSIDVGYCTSFTQCVVRRLVNAATSIQADTYFAWYGNVWLQAGTDGPAHSYFIGGEIDEGFLPGILMLPNFLDGDVILSGNAFGGFLISSSSQCFGKVYIENCTLKAGGGWDIDYMVASDSNPQSIIWGPGNLDFSGVAGQTYLHNPGATYASTFLLTGTLTIGGATTASAYDGAGTWHGGIAFTAAKLDTTVAGGGFGGTAINPFCGAVITNSIWPPDT